MTFATQDEVFSDRTKHLSFWLSLNRCLDDGGIEKCTKELVLELDLSKLEKYCESGALNFVFPAIRKITDTSFIYQYNHEVIEILKKEYGEYRSVPQFVGWTTAELWSNLRDISVRGWILESYERDERESSVPIKESTKVVKMNKSLCSYIEQKEQLVSYFLEELSRPYKKEWGG